LKYFDGRADSWGACTVLRVTTLNLRAKLVIFVIFLHSLAIVLRGLMIQSNMLSPMTPIATYHTTFLLFFKINIFDNTSILETAMIL